MKILCPLWIKFSVIAILWFHLWFTVTNWSLVWFLHPIIENYRSSSPTVPVLAESLQNCWPNGPGGTSHVLVTGKRRWLVNALYFVTALCLTCGVTLGPLEASSSRWFSLEEGGPWGQEWITHWMYFVVSLWLTCSPSGSTLWLLPLGPPTGGSLWKEVAPGDRGELLFECTLLYHSDSPILSMGAPCGSCR